jgi:hypothetical protein
MRQPVAAILDPGGEARDHRMTDGIREAVYLRGKAAQCLRMARAITDAGIARQLEELAATYAKRAAAIEAREDVPLLL